MLAINKRYQAYIVALLLVAVAFVFHYKSINEFPQYRHCWAQCDRYAIALGFIDNGGDLFHPQTFVYNKQFPDDFEKVRDNTITSVDFPVHDYIVSWLMRLFGTKDPWVFRLYILCYSIVGFFYLYKLNSLFTSSFTKQLCVLLFALSSSTILYYQAGFLPTIPSLANAMIALYFYFKYVKFQQISCFYIAIAFITLATLARLPFAILLVGICCVEFLSIIKNRKVVLTKILATIISFIAIGSYYVYNNHLRDTYGSLFLNYIIPAENFHVLVDYIITVYERWLFQYFSIVHYVLLVILTLIYLINLIRRKIQKVVLDNQLIFFTIIVLIGCGIYYVLMSFQFLNHDYYFLDSFYLPVILLFLFFVINTPPIIQRYADMIFKSLALLLFIPLFAYAHQIHKEEKENDFYKQKTTAQSFKNATLLLDSLGISKDAKILCIGADGVNNPFILMNRKGYTVVTTWQPHKIELALNWNFDYVVLENARLLNTIYNSYPNIINQLTKIGGNDDLSVYVKQKDNTQVNIDDFFGLNIKTKFYTQTINFDTIPANFTNTSSTIDLTDSQNRVGKADSTTEYAITHIIKLDTLLKQSNHVLKISSRYLITKQLGECLLCVSVKANGNEKAFLATNIFKDLMLLNQWTKRDIIFSLPQVLESNTEIGVFIWNTEKQEIYYDDIEYTIY